MKKLSELTIVANPELMSRLPTPEEFKDAIFSESRMDLSRVYLSRLKLTTFVFAEEVDEDLHPFTYSEAREEVERRWGAGKFILMEDAYPMKESGKTCFLQELSEPYHIVQGDTWEEAIMAWHLYELRED